MRPVAAIGAPVHRRRGCPTHVGHGPIADTSTQVEMTRAEMPLKREGWILIARLLPQLADSAHRQTSTEQPGNCTTVPSVDRCPVASNAIRTANVTGMIGLGGTAGAAFPVCSARARRFVEKRVQARANEPVRRARRRQLGKPWRRHPALRRLLVVADPRSRNARRSRA